MADKTALWSCDRDTVVRSQGGQWSSSGLSGAPGRKHLFIGRRDGRTYRSYLRFDVDDLDIGILKSATLVLFTDDGEFPLREEQFTRTHVIRESWEEGSSTSFKKSEGISPAVFNDPSRAKTATATAIGEAVRIDVTATVGQWLSKKKQWLEPGTSKTKKGGGKPNRGIRLRSKESGSDPWDQSCGFHSR